MSDLVFIAFPSEQKAEEVRDKVLEMQKEYLIELGDAVVAVKDANGRIKLNQLFQPIAQGTVSGMFWSSLIGLLFMTPVAGTVIRSSFDETNEEVLQAALAGARAASAPAKG